MKNIAIVLTLLVITACSAGQEIVIEPGGTISAQDSVATPEPVEDLDIDDDEIALDGIQEIFVDWGFRVASRTAGDIDTVIVHSVYNPFAGRRHSLDEVVGIFKSYGVAPHYIIGRTGTVYQTVKDKDVAWHAGRSRIPDGRTNINDFSIGIEMINSLDDVYTQQQYVSLRELIQSLDQRYGLEYVLGHDEIEVEDPWNFNWDKINDLRHNPR